MTNKGKLYFYGSVQCVIKKSNFMKKQETSGLLSSLELKILLSKFPILGDILL